nr:polysaccharide deacetylase family protein [Clostridia bacterium]
MKNGTKFIAAAVCLILVVVGIVCFSRSIYSAEKSYVTMFINDRKWVDEVRYGKHYLNGVYYVPVTFFDAVDGCDMKTNDYLGNVMLTYGRKYITFDTTTRTIAYTEEGGSFFMQTYMLRTDTLWVPIQEVALALGIHYEKTNYRGVDIIRLNNGYAAYTLDALAEMYNADETSKPETSSSVTETQPPVTSDTTGTDELGERLIYLTFEDLPNENTDDILNILSLYGYKAAFFLNGNAVSENSDSVRSIIIGGHTPGLHTMTQNDAAFRRDFELFVSELEEENTLLEKLFHLRTRIIRAPEGSASSRKAITISTENGERLHEMGYIIWDWNVNVPDTSSYYTAKQIAAKAIEGIKQYTVPVLRFHSTKKTVEALPLVLDFIKANPGCEVSLVTPASEEINLIGYYQ